MGSEKGEKCPKECGEAQGLWRFAGGCGRSSVYATSINIAMGKLHGQHGSNKTSTDYPCLMRSVGSAAGKRQATSHHFLHCPNQIAVSSILYLALVPFYSAGASSRRPSQDSRGSSRDSRRHSRDSRQPSREQGRLFHLGVGEELIESY